MHLIYTFTVSARCRLVIGQITKYPALLLVFALTTEVGDLI